MKYLFTVLALSSVVTSSLGYNEDGNAKPTKGEIKYPQNRRLGSISRNGGFSPKSNRLARQPKPTSTPAVPSYAVPMEPLVQYSQRDPLYHDKDDEPIVESLTTAVYKDTEQKSRIDHLVAEPSNHISEVTAPGYIERGGYNSPFYDHQSYAPHFYKEPEPIIEIIIKESNESLPAPPPPPTPPPAPATKEPVQVFYVKYKKNPNSHGKEDDVIYDPPIPALSPHTHDIVEPSSHSQAPTYGPPLVTAAPPPPPSTTIKAIIRPDSETYHGTSGLRISFGKPSEHGHDYSSYHRAAIADGPIEAQKRDSVSDQSEPHFSQISSSSPIDITEKPSVAPVVHAHAHKRQQNNEFQSQPTPDIKFTRQEPFVPSQPHIETYQTPPPPSFQQQPSQSINPQHRVVFPGQQQPPPFRPQHTNNVFNNRQQQPLQQNHQQGNQRSPPPPFHVHPPFNPNQRQQTSFLPPLVNPNQQRLSQPSGQNQVHRPFAGPPQNQNQSPQFPIPHASNYHPQIQPQQPNFQFAQNRPNGPNGLPFNPSQPFPIQPNPQASNNHPHLTNHQQQQQQHQHQPQNFNQHQVNNHLQRQPGPPPGFTPHHQQFNQPQNQQRLQQRPSPPVQYQPFVGSPQGVNPQNIQNNPQNFGPQQQPNVNFLHQRNQHQLQHHQPQLLQQPSGINQQHNFRQPTFHHQPNHHTQYNTQTEASNLPLSTQSNRPNYISLTRDSTPRQSSQPSTYRSTEDFRPTSQTYKTSTPSYLSNQYSGEQQQSDEDKSKYLKKVTIEQSFSQFPPNHKPEKESKYSSIFGSPAKSSKSQQVFVTSQTPTVTYPTTTARSTTYYTPTETTTFVSNQKKKLEKETKKSEKDKVKTSLAALPDEVPDDLREQLIASGILNNADIQILDYDKVGDIPIENLPPEALEQLQGAGSAPVPAIVAPDNGSVPLEMKVVRYNSESDGERIAETYVQEDATQLDPVVLNDSKYNRYLPLKVSGTQFPLPDTLQLNGRKVSSVVVLAPVDYEFIKAAERGSDERGGRAAAQVQGVRFIAGDSLKNLVKEPTAQNYKRWLDREKSMPAENQSVILLVTSPTEDSKADQDQDKDKEKEIFMYDVSTQKTSHLRGELSSTFVRVAESNAQSQDLDTLSGDDDETEAAASEIEPFRVLPALAPIPNKPSSKNALHKKDSTALDSREIPELPSRSIVISSGYSKTAEYAAAPSRYH